MNQPRVQREVKIVQGRLPALDGLRGAAILMVLVYHFTLYGGMQPDTAPDALYAGVAMLGWVGVDLFFVLSGFLITGILRDTRDEPFYFRNFYARRTLRIFPVYYATLIVAFGLIPALFTISDGFERLLGDQLWYWTYLVNFEVARDYWPEFFALGHLWSLAVEEQFYLLWPLLVFCVRGRRLGAVCIAIVAAAPLIRWGLVQAGSTLGAYVLMPARSDALALGALIALIARKPGGVARLARSVRPVMAVSASALLAMLLWRGGLGTEDRVVQVFGFSAVALFFGALLVLALAAPAESALGKLLRNRALRITGQYSYALYLFHHPIAIFLGANYMPVGSLPRLLGSQLPAQVFFFAVAGAASFALAWLSWRLIELPFLRLKTRFPYAAES
jgi:peptidoglycan/LPS O-acetylase OafA/YrhL